MTRTVELPDDVREAIRECAEFVRAGAEFGWTESGVVLHWLDSLDTAPPEDTMTQYRRLVQNVEQQDLQRGDTT